MYKNFSKKDLDTVWPDQFQQDAKKDRPNNRDYPIMKSSERSIIT